MTKKDTMEHIYQIRENRIRSFVFLFHEHINGFNIELVSKELNHLVAILHVYTGSLIFMK